MISPTSGRHTPQMPSEKSSKVTADLSKKIVPQASLQEARPFLKTWKLLRTLHKNGTYNTTLKALGFDPSSRFRNFFTIRKLIQSIGIEQMNFVLEIGAKESKTLETENLVRLEGIAKKLNRDLSNTSVINGIRNKILNSHPEYKESIKTELVKHLPAFGFDKAEADKIIDNDETCCNNLLEVLLQKGEEIGYREEAGMRSLSALRELFNGSLDDKCLALDLVKNQLDAADIQVKALKQIFSKVADNDLKEAIKQHYTLPSANESLEREIPIGNSSLAKFFFKNSKGIHEVALIYKSENPPSGASKVYRLVGTMAALEDIASLKLKGGAPRSQLRTETSHWKEQQEGKVRNIPLLYSFTESGVIFCENMTGGDVFDYVMAATTSDAKREELFQKAGTALLEYLQDIEKLGLVHRDIKPDNLLLSNDAQRVLITDFDLMARKNQDIDAAGSPAYVAPELWRGAKPQPSQDIFSAALTLAAIRYQQLEIPSGKNDPFDKLLLKMMDKDPGKRPNATQALEEWKKANEPSGGWFW